MKTCTRCEQEKPASDFYKKVGGKGGLFAHCKKCHTSMTGGRLKERREADPEFAKKENARTLEWARNNPDRRKANSRAYIKANLPALAARTARHRSGKVKRTPVWLDAVDKFEIECIYSYCGALRSVGLNYEVDHVVPLHGRHVSGLHVPSNLQVIPMTDNRSKSNKF